MTFALKGYERQLAALDDENRLRRLTQISGIDFSSNDYLGLARSNAHGDALRFGLGKNLPSGSAGSRLLRGNHEVHEALEIEAADYFARESTLYFPTGYIANLALFGTLPQRDDLVIYDTLIHASVHDGMKLGRAQAMAAAHNDAQSFEDAILAWQARGGKGRPWLAVESLYSMDGDKAPLADLLAIADKYDGFLIIDEAHAVGVYGAQGRGLAHELGSLENVIVMYGCGKALGYEGAFLAGARVLMDFIINRGRPFIFSTAPSPMSAQILRHILKVSERADDRRESLKILVAYTDTALQNRLGISPSGSHIQPVITGDNGRSMRLAATLQEAGYDIRAIRPPTVAEGTARLRLSITLNVKTRDIDAVIEMLEAHLI